MQFQMLTLVCLGLAASPLADAVAAKAEVNPISAVLEMISGLEAKVIQEGHSTQKVYEDFAEVCEDRSRQLHFDIKTEKANLVDLNAVVEQKTATILELTSKIEDLAGSTSENKAELKKATGIRAKEAADFFAAEKELMDVISTIQRASSIIEKEMQKGASFAQVQGAEGVEHALSALVQASSIDSADATLLTSLVQSYNADSSGDDDAGAPDAKVYENQSGGLLDALDGLLSKAEEQLAALRKEENEAKHSYELKREALEDEIKFGTNDMNAAKKALAHNQEQKAIAEGEIEAVKRDLKEDVRALGELHHDCMSKAAVFEDATKSRGEELNALATAKKIIKEATGGAEEQTYGLDQVSFLQVRSREASPNSRAISVLRRLAFAHKSASLAQLASRVANAVRLGASHGQDPFAKVTGLITDMIARLEKEAEADATHKAYCDKEMSETKAKMEDKAAELEKLSTKIEQMTAQSSKLDGQVVTLQKELSALTREQAEMDNVRQEEHAVYAADKPEMEQGLAGIKAALQVLRQYYAKDDEAAHDDAGGAASGIIGLLEVAESDFSKGLAEMNENEETAKAAYEAETKENQILMVAKDEDRKYKTKEGAALYKASTELSGDKSGVQEEADAVLKYMKELEKECVAVPESYEERKARREQEMAGLKEALVTLGGEPALVQRSAVRHTLRGGQLRVA